MVVYFRSLLDLTHSYCHDAQFHVAWMSSRLQIAARLLYYVPLSYNILRAPNSYSAPSRRHPGDPCLYSDCSHLMTRYSRHNASSSCFVASPSASVTAAIILGVLVTLGHAGLTRAKVPGTPEPTSTATTTTKSPGLSFQDSVSVRRVPPTSPLLSLADRPIDPWTLADAGSSTASFSKSSIHSKSML